MSTNNPADFCYQPHIWIYALTDILDPDQQIFPDAKHCIQIAQEAVQRKSIPKIIILE